MTAVASPVDHPRTETGIPVSAAPASTVPERLLVIGVLAIPFVVIAIALIGRDWFPTGDLAYAELRLRSMPRHIPLLGTAGRIADEAGRQGNHPGPLMFWAMWPFYVLFGRSSWAFSAAALAVNLGWTAAAVALAGLRLRFRGMLVLAAVLLALFAGFGLDALSQPWNPWMALYPFIALLIATWVSLLGVRWAPVVAVVAGSFSVQSHIGYVVVVIPLILISLVGAARSARDPDRRRGLPAPLPVLVAIGAGIVAWSGPLVDLVTAEHHNVGKLIHNFGSPDEPPVGILIAVKAVIRTLNPFVSRGSGTTVVSSSPWPALLFIGTWAVTGILVALRRLDRRLDRLNLVLATSLAFTVFAVSRIFGSLYLYVYRWAEVLLWLMVLALVWAAVRLLEGAAVLSPERLRPLRDRRTGLAAVAVLVVGALLTSISASRAEIPYEYTWKTERALAPAVADRLDPERRYLVRFDDPIYLFGVGFGMILELERRGFDVGAPIQWRAAIEPHRVRCGGDHDAVLTVVSGLGRIDRWRDDPDATEIAVARAGSPGAYEAQRERLHEALAAEGRTIPLDEVEDEIYGIFFFDRASPVVRAETEALIEVGAPTAVFLTDPVATTPTLCD